MTPNQSTPRTGGPHLVRVIDADGTQWDFGPDGGCGLFEAVGLARSLRDTLAGVHPGDGPLGKGLRRFRADLKRLGVRLSRCVVVVVASVAGGVGLNGYALACPEMPVRRPVPAA